MTYHSPVLLSWWTDQPSGSLPFETKPFFFPSCPQSLCNSSTNNTLLPSASVRSLRRMWARTLGWSQWEER